MGQVEKSGSKNESKSKLKDAAYEEGVISTRFFLFSIVMGILGGFTGVAFHYLILGVRWFFFDFLLPFISLEVSGFNISIAFLPIFGSLFASIIFYRAKDGDKLKGSGIPVLIESMIFEQSKISAKVGIKKLFASSLTIGSGGSGGKEGPIALIGGSISSYLGNKFKISEKKRRIIVVSGLAAGISGIFHAPIGGAIFGIEVLIQGVSIINTLPIFLSSAIGALIGRFLLTEHFGAQIIESVVVELSDIVALEILVIVVFSIICGFIGVFWIKMLSGTSIIVKQWNIKSKYKPLIGSLITGITLLFFPVYGINGSGMDGIQKGLNLEYVAWLVVLLGFLKMVATASTIGSGNSGGIFGPTLYIGTMFGLAFGYFFDYIFPTISIDIHVFALIGMAAIFSASTLAPINIAIMVAEISHNFDMLPFLLISSIISYSVSRKIMGNKSIYTSRLQKEGINVKATSSLYLERTTLNQVVEGDLITIPSTFNLEEFTTLSEESKLIYFPVVSTQDNEIIGVISKVVAFNTPNEQWDKTEVDDLMDKDFTKMKGSTKLQEALDKMLEKDRDYVVVMSDTEIESKSIIKSNGIISKEKILNLLSTDGLEK